MVNKILDTASRVEGKLSCTRQVDKSTTVKGTGLKGNVLVQTGKTGMSPFQAFDTG